MCKYPWILHILKVLIYLTKSTVQSEYDTQPKLLTSDGSLFLEVARDKNITMRLTGDAALHINDMNILDLLKKSTNTAAAGSSENTEGISISAVNFQLKNLHHDILELTKKVSFAEKRIPVLLRRRRRLQFDMRVLRLLKRINLVERNLDLDDCQEKQPCQNGGSCYDLYKDFYCECTEGWSGKTCSEDIDECYILTGSGLGCQNNALCINIPGSYRCNCTTGFSGTHCRLRNAKCDSQQSSELCANGACVNANNAFGYACICNEGWFRNSLTTACTEDVNECESTRNPCHSECINLPGSFRCGPCPKGYTGDGITCFDVDECKVNNGGCSQLPLVPCINTEGSHHCGNCPPEWNGNGRTCTKAPTNSCDNETICHPNARCTYISGTAICTCLPGWYGHGFGENGCSMQMIENQCDNHKCKNNGTCVISYRGTQCVCPLGFMGAFCEQKDACNPNPCENGGRCKLLSNNTFECECRVFYTGFKCQLFRKKCGRIFNKESGEMTYPPDGGYYEPYESCYWIIRTAPTKILNVTFSKFDLETDAECNKDSLQIMDSRVYIGRFCGNTLPLGGSILSPQWELSFWFRSDNATNGSGFKMTWTSLEPVCGKRLTLESNDNGVIRSPGYPETTPALRECEWNLNAPFGYRLILRFYEVNLGGDKNCTNDTLKIYDADQLLVSVCQTSLPEPKHTSSNKVLVHFHTDAYRADSSFQLHYEVVPGNPYCGGYYTEHTGIFSGNAMSPVCLYLIEQPLGTKIKLELELHFKNCGTQKIEVFDGKTDEADVLNFFCNGDKKETIESSGNSMLVRYEYRLAPLKLPRTFQAKYERICGEKIFGSTSGIFATPNYPQPYFEHLTCIYDINGPIKTVVHVNFTDFSISESVPYMPEDNNANGASNISMEVDDFMNYVDVYLSDKQKRRYYKGDSMQFVSTRNRMRIVFHGYDNKRRSRGLRVEYRFETIECGGVLTDMQGSFSRFFYDTYYIARNTYSFGRNAYSFGPFFDGHVLSRSCEWVLEAPEGKSIKLDLEMKLSRSDYRIGGVYIFINIVIGNHIVASYSNAFHEIEVYHSNVVRVVFYRWGTALPYLIKANYIFIDDTLECGGNFTYRYGVIKSPGWPQAYPLAIDCTWIIAAPLGHKIEILAQNFSLETTSPACGDDYLEIRNGQSIDSPLIGKYCGNDIPQRIPSFTNHLYLHFHSDVHISDAGFYLTWEQTATGCGGNLNSHKGSIHSPHYPEISAGPVLCTWQITVAEGSRMKIKLTSKSKFLDFCRDDVLTIFDGAIFNSHTLRFSCTLDTEGIILKSSSNQVIVRYTLENGAENGQQFLLDYETDCVRRIDDLLGVIESPNFPEYYPPNMNCEWDIRGGKNNKISLIFSHLRLEKTTSGCNYDNVTLIDMLNEEILKTLHLCADLPDTFTTEGNRVMLKFVSDYSEEEEGFRVEFKRLGCGEHFQQEVGSIKSPNAPYSVDIDCDWFIEVPAGKQIVLNINVHIETDSLDCSSDVLRVANDKRSIHYLSEECQVESMPFTMTSMANTMYIHFHTSKIRARKYFEATYTTKDSTCGGIYHPRNGFITSPNYPDKYLPNSVCVWSLIVDTTKTVYGIVKVDLPESENCNDSYLDVSHVSAKKTNTRQRYCGSQEKLVIFRRSTDVIFKSGLLQPRAGFTIEFTKSCVGYLGESSSFLESTKAEDCFWNIDTDEGSYISVDILHLECQNTTSQNEYLKISDKLNSDDSNTFCTTHPANIVLRSNQVFIWAKRINFRAKYSSIQNSCGGTLSSLNGILTSPYYPNTYPPNIECVWEIQAARGNTIEINFDFIGIAISEKCNVDFLELRQSGGILRGVYCGAEAPNEMLTFSETVWIKFRSKEGSTGSGFKLRWNYAHANSLNGTHGIIEPPPVHSIQRLEDPYTWRIDVARGNLIRVSFKDYNKGLHLYDGFDETALEINIQYSPWEFTSGTNVLLLKSDNLEIKNFNIEWTAISKAELEANLTISKCQQEIMLPFDARINVSSQGYPKGDDEYLHCSWIVQTKDPTQHAVLSLYDIDLESIDDCNADYLRVSTSSNRLSWHEELKTCQIGSMDSISPLAVIHGKPNLKLEFHAVGSVNRRGFTSILTTACGSNMTLPSSTIISPILSRSRFYNSTCLWHIQVRSSKRIEFTFEFDNIKVKPNDACRQYAIIYDGIDNYAPLLEPGKICNQIGRNVSRLVTSSNHATVKYNIPLNVGEIVSTWNLTYREFSECGDEIRLSHGTWVTRSSPRYPNIPQPHSECSWLFIAPAGETLQVDFLDPFDMSVRYCTKEYVELFDGSTSISQGLGRFCTRPSTVRTSGNVLLMRYLTDVAEPRMGFRANVSVSTCGGTFTDFSGVITSVGYPALGVYSTMSSCDYVIKLPTFDRIKLNFIDLHLPFNQNAEDYLEIFLIDPSTKGQRNNIPFTRIFGNASVLLSALELDSNEVLIRLKSFEQNHRYRGFKIKYEKIFGLCYKEVNGESGNLKVVDLRTCYWKITVPKGQRVRIEFPNLQRSPTMQIHRLNADTQAQRILLSKFSFYNDDLMLSQITEFNLTTYNSSQVIQSTDNLMKVRVQHGFDAPTVLLANYSSDEETLCPDDILERSSGRLSLRQLIETNANFYCRVGFIWSGNNETLAIKILELQTKILSTFYRKYPIFFKDDSTKVILRALNTNVTNTVIIVSVRQGSVTMLQTEYDRILKFEAVYRRHACGGQYSLEDGFAFSSPEIIEEDENYSGVDCLWLLNAGTAKSGFWLAGNITLTQSCEEEYLEIYASSRPEYGLIAKICKDSDQFNSTELINLYTTVVYHSNSYKRGKSTFNFVVEKPMRCNDDKYLTKLGKTYLNFPAKFYKNNMECIWQYEAVQGFYLSLSFVGNFVIEDSTNCSKDYLEVQHFQDDFWISAGRYCGRKAPAPQSFTSKYIRLIFRSDENITAEGFSMAIELTCFVTFNVTKNTQMITTPDFIALDIKSLHCEFILLSNTDQHIHVHLIDKTLKVHCELFSVTTYKRDDTYSRRIIQAEKYCIEAEFRADKYLKLVLNALYPRDVRIAFKLDSCGGAIKMPTSIRSHAGDSDDNYIDNAQCIWNVTAPKGHSIMIKFKFFEMKFSWQCHLDHLDIYAGALMNKDKRIARLCTNLTAKPPMITVDSNKAIIAANSDGNTSYPGFFAQLYFTKNCSERISLTDGHPPLTLLRHFVFNGTDVMLCNYRIMAPSGYRIRLDIRDLQLSTPECKLDLCDEKCNYIEIFDSVQVKRTSMGKYCNTSNGSAIKLISSNEDAVIFVSATQAGTFSIEIVLEMEAPACGNTTLLTLDENDIHIIFPQSSKDRNELELYPPNTHCSWRLSSKDVFFIEFKAFSLQNISDVTGKCLDYVHVNTTFDSIYFCGNTTGFEMRVLIYVGDIISITFHSDDAIESTGFHLVATYKRACNQTYTDTSGTIDYDPAATSLQVCSNEIRVPENYTISIFLRGFEIPSDNCTEHFFRVVDIKTNETLHQQCQGQDKTLDLFTTLNAVRITYALNSFSLLYISNKNTSPPGCGGEVYATTGTFSSPPSDKDRNLSECRWDIIVPAPNRISIAFTSFDMGSSINCALDYVNIIEVGSNNNEEIRQTYCGRTRPRQFLSESSHIALFSRKTPNFDATGWTIWFRIQGESTSILHASNFVDIFQ